MSDPVPKLLNPFGMVDLKVLLEDTKIAVCPPPYNRGMQNRCQDDHDGTHIGRLLVHGGPDGDMYVGVHSNYNGEIIRFRNWSGGGRSLRVHRALCILAEAIHLDEKDDPLPKAHTGETLDDMRWDCLAEELKCRDIPLSKEETLEIIRKHLNPRY